MTESARSRGRWRRVREVGVGGVARRLRSRLAAPLRVQRQAAWRAAYVEQSRADRLRRAGLDLGAASLTALCEQLGRRGAFFLDTGDRRLADAFAARHPAALDKILCQARAARDGDVSFVAPGATPDWNAILPGGGRWPAVAPEQTGYTDPCPPGDVRLTWELGRCAHLVRLAQAAWLTGERGFAEAALGLLRGFAAENPPGVGVAWAHAQEAALRATAWLWVFQLLRPLGALDAADFEIWLEQILAHGDFVTAHLSDGPATHNHLVSEAAGLFVLGAALPELRPARRWRRSGARLLRREILKQVDGEGVHWEGATHYHAFVLDSCLAALLLADRAGLGVPARVRARVAGLADVLALLMRADGTLPAIGDTDSGRAWRLGLDPLDRRDALAAAAIAFERPDWGALAGDAPGAFFLAGGRPVPGAGAPPPPGRARRFAAAGLAVARSGFGPDAEIFVFRVGATRLQADVLGSHRHADALSVLWRVGADDVLVDPGTFLYSEGAGWRAWLRGTSSHSCVVVDGRDQADVRSMRFGIAGLELSRWLHCDADTARLCACAEHPAGTSPRVRRRVAWTRGVLALCDDVLGAGEHDVESWLQLPRTTGEAEAAGARLRLGSGRALLVQVAGDARALSLQRPDAADAAKGPAPGWLAPRFGERAPGTALRIDAGRCRLPARLVTVLQVGGVGGDAPREARVEVRDDGGVRVHATRATGVFAGDGEGVRLETAS